MIRERLSPLTFLLSLTFKVSLNINGRFRESGELADAAETHLSMNDSIRSSF